MQLTVTEFKNDLGQVIQPTEKIIYVMYSGNVLKGTYIGKSRGGNCYIITESIRTRYYNLDGKEIRQYETSRMKTDEYTTKEEIIYTKRVCITGKIYKFV